MRQLSLLLIFLVFVTEAFAQLDNQRALRKNDWWIGSSIGVTHSLAENATANDFLKNYPGGEFQIGTFLSRDFGVRLSMGLNPQSGRPGQAQREGDPETYDTHYRFNVLTGYVDGLIDLTTIFTDKRRKYRPTFDMILFAGAGGLESFHFEHDKVADWIYYPVDAWDKTCWAAHVGLMASYRIGKHWDWTLEGSYNFTDSKYDGVESGVALGVYAKLHTGWVYHFNDRNDKGVKLRNEIDDSWQAGYNSKDRQRAAHEQAKRIEAARKANQKVEAERRKEAERRIEAMRKLQKQQQKQKEREQRYEGATSTGKSYVGPGNWFMGLEVGTSLAMAENVSAEDFFKTKVPSGSLQIGRTLNPWVSLRLMASIYPQLGHASAIAMRYDKETYTPYQYYAATGTLDAMLNIVNMCRKFDARNWFDGYLVLGGGALYSFGFDKKVELWDPEIYPVNSEELLTWVGKAGLMGSWHVAKAWDLTSEIDFNATENAFNGVVDREDRKLDFFLSLKIGMTYYFGNGKGRHHYANPKKEHRYWKDL